MTATKPALIEVIPIPRTFCTELARLERIGPCTVLVFAAEHSVDFDPTSRERTVEARIVVPTDYLPAIARAILAHAAGELDPDAAALAAMPVSAVAS